jgi:hypothetical protein
MKYNLLFRDEIRANNLSKIDIGKYGVKANNLLKIPIEYCPEYAILAEDSITQENITKIYQYFKELNCNKLIVRSSSSSEYILARGKYHSEICNNNTSSIHRSILKVFNYFKTHCDLKETLGIIIQVYISYNSKGHFSNSNRVVNKANQYLIEIEHPTIKSFNVERDSPINKVEGNVPKKLIRQLLLFLKEYRYKFRLSAEWVFSKGKLYIVQIDYVDLSKIKYLKGNNDCFIDFKLSRSNYFIPYNQVNIEGNKLLSIKKIKHLNFLPNDFLILPFNDLVEAIINENITKEQKKIIDELCLNKIVIRTDVKSKEDKDSNLLLPRSNIIYKSNQFITFIKNVFKNKNIIKSNYLEIYFLIHKFTYAKKSALVDYDYLNNEFVISASYGIPDSLLYYNSDNYLYNLKTESIFKYIQTKNKFIQIDTTGNWSVKKYPKKYLNYSVLTNEEINDIINKSVSIFNKLNVNDKNIFSFMFFIDIPNYHDKSILWHFYKKVPINIITKNKTNISHSVLVENIKDMEKLYSITQPVIIKLKPSIEIIRNKDFILSLADFAKNNSHVIEFEGSILSHIFYLLQSNGVQVIS